MAETWRDRMRPLVDQAITSGRSEGLEGKALLRYVQRSYPWGNQVGHHGRKIWLSESRVQLKMKTPAEQKAIDSRPMPLFGDAAEGGA
jgi:hypothetical protein